MIRSQNLNSISSFFYQKHDYIHKNSLNVIRNECSTIIIIYVKKVQGHYKNLRMRVGIQAERFKAWNRN